MKKFLTLFALAAIALFGFRAAAQLVTTSPDVLCDDSQDVVLYFHADSPEGNGALRNLSLIPIGRWRRIERWRSRWSPEH